MDDKSATIKVEDSIVSSKTFSSDLMPIKFGPVKAVVKNEPITEDAETHAVDKLIPSLSTANSEKREIKAESIDTLSEVLVPPVESLIPLRTNSSEKREIKAESIDTLSEDVIQPAESLAPLCINSNNFMDANVIIKKEEDSEICIEEERFADCNSSVSFMNEENHYCLGEVHSTAKVKGKICKKDDIVRMPTVSLTEAQNSTDIEASLKAVPPVSISKNSFQCSECESSFRSKNLLRTHVADYHGKPFLCFHCPAAFSKSGEWNLHLASHSGAKIFSCECNAAFRNKDHLTKHRIGHFKEGQSAGTPCSVAFSESREIETQLATHSTKKPFFCEQCLATFKYKSHLEKHLIAHTKEKSFSCPYCPGTFNKNSNLRYHMKWHLSERKRCPQGHRSNTLQSAVQLKQCSIKAHAVRKMNQAADKIGENETVSQVPAVSSSAKAVDHTEYDVLPVSVSECSLKCLECGSKYQTRQSLRIHQNYQHGKPFSCIHCLAAFFKNEELSLHLASHASEKLFACRQCPAVFKDKQQLMQHMTSHSRKRPSTEVKEVQTRLSTPAAKKLFSCDGCSLTFRRKVFLQRHSVIHYSRRALSCDQCSAVFYENHRLQKHMKIHVKPSESEE